MLKSTAALISAPIALASFPAVSAVSLPVAAANLAGELSGLMAAIDRHRVAYASFGETTPLTDELDERYDPSRLGEYEAADEAERQALKAIIEYRTETIDGLRAKARYLADIDDIGSLNYEQAYEFLHAVARF